MAQSFNIGVLVGSLRKDSISRKAATALIALAPASFKCNLIEIRDLAMYDEDLDVNPPEAWVKFKQQIAHSDAFLFITPEYNRTLPGCLKNALDVASRPQGENAWDGKPAAIVSVTPYRSGAFGANHALRQALVFLNIPAMQQPEAYIGDAAEMFGNDGTINVPATTTFFKKFMASFEDWVSALHESSGQSFDEFMQQRKEASTAYVQGDASLLDKLVPAEGDASFFSPAGGTIIGANAVKTRYDRDAKSFGPSSKSDLNTIQSVVRGGLAFWTGVQEAEVEFAGKKQPMKLRTTEIYMRQDGTWKLVHRHADMNADPKPH